MPKDRSAEQAWEWWQVEHVGRVAAQQATGNFLWIGVDDLSEMQRL